MISPVQEIKDRLDIVDFIRSYIPLQPAGKNFKANCPFHKEKTPSFMVSPERQTWHCFGACSEGGDIFKFLMKYENLEFYEALKILAEKAGVELKRISPAESRQIDVLYEINEEAKEFFRQNLKSSEEVKKYLASRGLNKETVEEFELGLAPENYDALNLYLIKKKYSAADIERAGLAFKNERGNLVDRFRGRIMFPLYNHSGKIVGFSGRILPRLESSEIGKYINSPETIIFNKSRILYGFHKTKNFIREQKSAIIVEGQMDFLLTYQDGVKNVVATSGTSLTVDHLKVLKRLADEIIFCFDNDEAGLKAAERSVDLAYGQDLGVKIAILKDYKDPAEAVLKVPGTLLKFFKQAGSAMEFYFDRYLQNADSRGNINELKKNIRIILSKIKNLASPIEKSHWLKELSLKAGVKEEALIDELNQIKSISRSDSKSVGLKMEQSVSRRELIAERLIKLIMAKEDLRHQTRDYLIYLPNDYLEIVKGLVDRSGLEERLANKLNLISLRSSLEFSHLDEEAMNFETGELLRQLKTEYFKEKREELFNLIKKAEINGDSKKINSVLEEFDKVSKLIHNI